MITFTNLLTQKAETGASGNLLQVALSPKCPNSALAHEVNRQMLPKSIPLVISARKSLAYWRMFQLTVMSISRCDTRLKVISDVNVSKHVHDTVHLDFGRSYADGDHNMPPKRLGGAEILA
jgi:hypothetical protein